MKKSSLLLLLSLPVLSCSVHEWDSPASGEAEAIRIAGSIQQEYLTRASDDGFADGDEIGIYVVDYAGSTPGELSLSGTRASNLRFTFDESTWSWTPDHEIYYKDKDTHIDVYGYYPYGAPESIEAYPFEVQKDQADGAGNGKMGGYEASDFLWGKTADVAPSSRTIQVTLQHRMACARVTLVEGSGFDSAEWAALDKSVVTESAVRTATINLRTGVVSVTGSRPAAGTITCRRGNEWRCIIVPQTIEAGDALFSVSVGGLPYSLRKGDAFTFVPGKQHNFTITVNKRSETGTYEFVLSGESITPWENDPVSHDAVAREYVIVNVPQAGTLEQCIAGSGKDLNRIQNLKIVGNLTGKDFGTIKRMASLRSLNLKETRIKKGEAGTFVDGIYEFTIDAEEDDVLPARALSHMQNLLRLILPDELTGINFEACYECRNLSGSLVIPEGVTWIGQGAFSSCRSLMGSLSLPTTLTKIGAGAFGQCGFNSELALPESLRIIEDSAFSGCSGLYGSLHLPSHLQVLGREAFRECGFTGNLEIPQTLTEIGGGAFLYTHFNGTLTLHDGLVAIGENAFGDCGFRGELLLPKDLVVLSDNCFSGCDFSGNLVIPDDVAVIGRACFALNWRLIGTVVIPANVQSVGEYAFSNCRMLEGVVFEEGVETIGKYAFENCFGLGSIACKSAVPPYLQEGVFDGVPKDNFTLEVPETAIATYATEPGWSDFKRIAAYRNLVVRPSMATAINTPVTRDLVLDADEEWEVESLPDWVALDKTSGTGKTELRLSFSPLPQGGEPREGEVVFKLQDKDYRTRCKVTQYDYTYAEDEIIRLQAASRGDGNNLVILGDGFDAKDISEGKLMAAAEEVFGYFFDIEPYKSYREYFNVYTAVSVSPESGIGNVNRIVYNRFNTKAAGGGVKNGASDWNEIMKYACKAPTVNEGNLGGTLVIMIPNTSEYGGICYMFDDGFAVAYCPMSDYGYPLDFRGVVQHEAGGHGFGKLLDEYIYHNEFIDGCGCSCCPHDFDLALAKAAGYGRNLSLTGKMNEVDWAHLIFHPKYRGIVDIFEGGYMHTRSVYRSEQNSCMNNDIPYYSTISRQAIVERIKALAGETFSLEDFIEKDVVVSQDTYGTRSLDYRTKNVPMDRMHSHPQFMGSRPAIQW